MTISPLSRITLSLAMLVTMSLALAQEQVAVSPGRIVISGAVPDEATKAALIARLEELYGAGQIVDQINVGGVIAPPNWSRHVAKMISPNLKSISKGQIRVEGMTVSMRGEVGSEAMRQAVASDFALALDSNYVVKNGLRVTATSQALLDKVLDNRVVEFEPGSALLTVEGKTILDEMTVALKKANAQKFEVIGHTDNLGIPDHNMALSRARAESVKTYLVMQGIPPELVGTSGMGASQPIDSNASNEGRRRNRRIEFRVSQ